MKTILSLFLATTFALCGQDAPKEFERLETTKGKVYEHVKVRKVEPDGIAIIHDSGTAKVPFESLSVDLQKAYGFDPTKAAEHRAASNAAQAQAEAAVDAEMNEIAKRKSDHVAGIKNADADKALRDRVKGLARKVSVNGFQNSDIGIIGDIFVMKPVSLAVKGSMIQKEIKWVSDRKEDGVIRGTRGASAGNHVDMTGRPYGGRDFTTVVIDWSGLAWRIGSIRYKTGQGLLRTCPLFTALEDDAVQFYKQHGFTQAAVDAVLKAD